ncbi:hypothetical protein CCHL11_00954, partial [Colletotrichum chlorophyti]
RVIELERKIDGLVNLFQSQQQLPQNHDPSPTTARTQTEGHRLTPCTGSTVSGENRPSTSRVSPVISPETYESRHVPTPDEGIPSSSWQLVPGFIITIEKAEESLSIYRTRMVPNFPFVPIDPSVTAKELHSQKPFLFWCIMQAVVPLTAPVQTAVGDWVCQYVALHLVVNKEKSLDMLQALVVYLAWGDIHGQMGINTNTLLQLTIGLVLDMTMYTLNTPLSWMPKGLIPDAWVLLGKGKQVETKQSLEEQRAILGGYYIASCVPPALRRQSQIQFSNQIAKCFKSICETRELPSDDNLIALIRLQNLGDRIRAVFPTLDRDEGEPAPIFREHFNAVLSSLRKELRALEMEEPAITKEQPFVWMQYTVWTMRLYEPVINMRAASPSEAFTATEPYSRTQALWSCLEAVKVASNGLLAIPAESYAYMPFQLVSGIAFAMMTSCRILLEDSASDWDVTLARSKLDYLEISSRILERLEEADNVALIVGQRRRLFEDNSSKWTIYATRGRWLQQWFVSKLGPPPQESTAEQQQTFHGLGSNESTVPWLGEMTLDQSFWDVMMLEGVNLMASNNVTGLSDAAMFPSMPST